MIEIDTFEHAGLTVGIVPDEYADDIYDPREHDGQLGVMHCYHPSYDLGDEQLPRDGFAEIECPVCEGGERTIEGPVHQRDAFGQMVEDEPVCQRCENFYRVEPTIHEWLREQGAVAAMPLFLLDHSGLRIRAGTFRWVEDEQVERSDTESRDRFIGDSAGWDTSFIGFIIATNETLEETGVTRDREEIERQLRVEVEEYDKYLSGDLGGFVVKDANDNVLDSCWGYLGLLDEHVREDAKRAAEDCREMIERENAERAHWAARDVVTT